MNQEITYKKLIFSQNVDRPDSSFRGCKCFCAKKKSIKNSIFCSNCTNYVHLDCEEIDNDAKVFFEKYSENILYCCSSCLKNKDNIVTKNTTDSILSDISRSLSAFVDLKHSRPDFKTYANVVKQHDSSSVTRSSSSDISMSPENFVVLQQRRGENCRTNDDLKVDISKKLPGSQIVSCKRLSHDKVLVKCHDISAVDRLVKCKEHNIVSYKDYQLEKKAFRLYQRGVPNDFSDELLKDSISSDNIEIIRLKNRIDSNFSSILISLKNRADFDRILNNGFTCDYLFFAPSKFFSKEKFCTKCQKYNHLHDKCKSEKASCGKCGNEHETKSCSVTSLKCLHCYGSHLTGSTNCPNYKQVKSLLQNE